MKLFSHSLAALGAGIVTACSAGLLNVNDLIQRNCRNISEDDPVIGSKVRDYKARTEAATSFMKDRVAEERARGEKPIEIF